MRDSLSIELANSVKQRLNIAYLFSNKDGVLIGSGGALNYYGIDKSINNNNGTSINTNTKDIKLAELLPATLGFEEVEEEVVLPMIGLGDKVVDIHMLPAENGGLDVLLVDATSAHDQQQVIQQKANEVQLLNKKLEKTLIKLNKTQAELKKKKEEAEVASQAKSQFIAGMSHEFRTPLTSVLGYTEILEREQQKQDHKLGAIRRGAEHLLSMVDNLLDHARFENQEIIISYAPVNLDQLLKNVYQLFEPLAAEKELKLNLEFDYDNELYEVDQLRLRQVLVNIIGNAIKYTQQGAISISGSVENEQLVVQVSDTGVGIPETQQEAIFDAFFRLKEHHNHAGAGIGLSITKHILELMGGWLTLESELGQGSTFSLYMPINKTPKNNEIEDFISKSCRVLLAEDNDDIANMIVFFLNEMQCEVTRVRNGNEAVAAFNQTQPDLVLMDINMPELNGYEATKILRKQKPDAAILALTASPSSQDRKKAQEAGFDNYLTKPISFDSLHAAIKSYSG